jgi:fatty acid desaturase
MDARAPAFGYHLDMAMTHPSSETAPADVESLPEAADPEWFREPTPREHRMAAALFVAFGVSFALLFIVLGGWWFRWVILGLGVLSALHGLWHAAASRRAVVPIEDPQSKTQNH